MNWKEFKEKENIFVGDYTKAPANCLILDKSDEQSSKAEYTNKAMTDKAEELKTAFNIVYPNVPLPERRMPIAVVDGEPHSWKIVRIELNTKVGKEALKQMRKLKII